jgi:hypothetical protein
MKKRKKKNPVHRVALSERDYLHGDLVVSGDRQALVVRTELDRWNWFPFYTCRQLLLGYKREDTERAPAYAAAVAYVASGTLPQSPTKSIPRLSNERDELVVQYLQEVQATIQAGGE